MKPSFRERLLRGVYSAILYLLAPITLYHLIWRGFRQPAYFQRWGERYGLYAEPPAQAALWLHAVSVGEVAAAAPLVNALLERHPGRRLVITSITPTGSERVRALWGERVAHVYLPYDLPGAVGRFLDAFRPEQALIMETELWPNLLFGCRDRGIPVAIINARLSARSLRGYRILAPLVARALASVGRICAQTDADAERFVTLGARSDAVVVSGNLKFDVPEVDRRLADEIRRSAGTRPVWIAASTHPDEEEPVIRAHQVLRQRWPDALLLWAPRHPERFATAAALAQGQGWETARRSEVGMPDADTAVFVLDTLGELTRCFAAADVAFVGGSLQAIGGHNLLEPASVGCAIVTGPHLHNFSEIAARLKEAGALCVVEDAEALAPALATLLGSEEKRIAAGQAGRALVVAGRGALPRILTVLGL